MLHSRLCRISRLLVLFVASTVLGGAAAALCIVGSWDVVAPPPPVEAPAAPENHLTKAPAPEALALAPDAARPHVPAR
jgi:hypothetical protein